MDNILFARPEGVLSFRKKPPMFRLFLYSRRKGGFDFTAGSNNGYVFRVPRTREGSSPARPDPGSGESPSSPEKDDILKYTIPSGIGEDGNPSFSWKNPLHLLFPFYAKPADPAWIVSLPAAPDAGDTVPVEINSPLYGRFRLYVARDKQRQVKRAELLDSSGAPFATAFYDGFQPMPGGGWIYQKAVIHMAGKPVLSAILLNGTVNAREENLPGSAEYLPASAPPSKPVKKSDWWAAVIVLILLLAALQARVQFEALFQKNRDEFSREILVFEGKKDRERLSPILTEMGFRCTPFSSEEMTADKARVEGEKKDLPRILVIGPGMGQKIRSFNYLVKSYVSEGGRVIVFEHDPAAGESLPFCPVLEAREGGKEPLQVKAAKTAKEIFKTAGPQDTARFLQGLQTATLLTGIHDPDMMLEPVMTLTGKGGDFAGHAVCVVKDDRGEYLVIQQPLGDALQETKTRSQARKVLRDILGFMSGGDRPIDRLPEWLQKILQSMRKKIA
jgi:hypothetical protein